MAQFTNHSIKRHSNRKTFIYLVACVGVAMSKQQRKRNVILALDHFRYLATETMFSRWRLSETDAVDAIFRAAESLRALCFNPSSFNRGYASDWSRAWLSEIEVVESNPVRLLQIAKNWKEMTIFVLDYLEQVKIGES